MRTTPTPARYHLRSITPLDRVGLAAFYAALSVDSRAARFHGVTPCVPEVTTTFLCGPDHQHREGIVADEERPQLETLMRLYRVGLVRKAEAIKIAVGRNLRPPLG